MSTAHGHRIHWEGNGGGVGTKADIHRYQLIQAQYLKLLTKEVGPWVLDVGAADGYLGKCCPEWRYTAVDPYPAARGVLKGTIDDVRGKFNLIVYNHVLEHIPRYDEEIEKASRKLWPGGFLFIAVPLSEFPWSWTIETHVNLFNEPILDRLVKRHGLMKLEAFTVCFREGKPTDPHPGKMVELWHTSRKPVL